MRRIFPRVGSTMTIGLGFVLAWGILGRHAAPAAAQNAPKSGTVAIKPRGPIDDPELIPIGMTPVPSNPAPFDPGEPTPPEPDGPDSGDGGFRPRAASAVSRPKAPMTVGDPQHSFIVSIRFSKPAESDTDLTISYSGKWGGQNLQDSQLDPFIDTSMKTIHVPKGADHATLTLATRRFTSGYAQVRIGVRNPQKPNKRYHCWVVVAGAIPGGQ